MVFQTQVPISFVILVIGIQDLYMSKYKYTIIYIRECKGGTEGGAGGAIAPSLFRKKG